MNYYILFGLLLAKSVEPFSQCDRIKWNTADITFQNLAVQLMELDRRVQDTCKQFPTFEAREIFAHNAYRLEVKLPGFDQAKFVVQIKHRLIYINAHYPRTGVNVCDLTYVDIKVLPEFANTHSAAWTYNNGVFMVAFPYTHELKEYNVTYANQHIDETMITLSRRSCTEKIFLD